MLIVERCSSCGGGNLGLLTCGGCTQTVAICDECDTLWINHPETTAPIFPEQPELSCPHCGASLLHGHWSTPDEIAGTPWADCVTDEGPALGETGAQT